MAVQGAPSMLAYAISRVACQCNIDVDRVFAWRKLFRERQSRRTVDACTQLPVTLAAVAAPVMPQRCPYRSSAQAGSIERTVSASALDPMITMLSLLHCDYPIHASSGITPLRCR
jgi:transposase-like protein